MTILEDARAVLADPPVCDACLGRVFADRSHGLRNEARGRALRTTIAIIDDVPYESPDQAACWVCTGRCGEYDVWADRIIEALDGVTVETYQVGTRVPPLIEENDELLRETAGLDVDAGELFKSAFNREVGKRVGDRLGIDVDLDRPDVVAVLELDDESVDVQVNSAFVYGRYRKHSRDLPQTEWPCTACEGEGTVRGDTCTVCEGSGYRYEDSVEQLIAPNVRDAMTGSAATFHGAGREDIDARMLGTGRPFVVEVTSPHDRFPAVDALETTINDSTDKVDVDGLRLATYESVERVKELDADKTYRATVEFSVPVETSALQAAATTLDGATIEQHTPERVDHRRASRTRTRRVHRFDADRLDETHAEIEVDGEGGLYVKELVSGDNGRTTPSLAGELGVRADITELDVLAVDGVEEPFEDPSIFRDPPG